MKIKGWLLSIKGGILGGIVVAVLLSLAAPADAQSRFRTIEEYCKYLHPQSWSLYEICVRLEREAEQRLRWRRTSSDTWNYCSRLHADSWRLAEVCVNREEQARDRMQQCLYPELCR